MAQISAAGSIEALGTQAAKPAGTQTASLEVVDMFQHLLGQQAVEPQAPAHEKIANILANPSTLGEHILANVEGMHESFRTFTNEIESRLAPPEAEGRADPLSAAGNAFSVFSNPGAVDNGGVYGGGIANGGFATGVIDVAYQPAASAGPAAAPLNGAEANGKSEVSTEYSDWQSSAQEFMWTQYNIGRIVVHQEMMAGALGKSTQNLDMLLRGQ